MISLRKLATLCNVSATTVSKALRDDPSISEATRSRIKTMAESLNYRPNRLANVIFSGRTQLFALLVGRSMQSPLNRLVMAAQDHAFDHGYGLLLYNTNYDINREVACLHHALENRVAGVIVSTVNYHANERHFSEAIEARVPVVVTNAVIRTPNLAMVHGDDPLAARLLVEHLLSLGHRRIGHLAEPRLATEPTGRFEGYRETLISANIAPPRAWTRICQWSLDSGRAEADTLLRDQPDLTALFCANDLLALGALQAAQALGRRVPEDLSLVGMGNSVEGAQSGLTTIESHHDAIGRAAIDALLELQDWAPTSELPKHWQDCKLPGELIIRTSTAPAP